MSKKPINPSDIGKSVPLFPLSNALLLPQTQRPFVIFETRYLKLIDDILQNDRLLGLIQPAHDQEESPKGKNVPLKKTGCIGYLSAFQEQLSGEYTIVLEGICRFNLKKEIVQDKPYRCAEIDLKPFIQDFDIDAGVEKVDRPEFLESMRQYAEFANINFDWAGIENIQTALLINMCCVLAPYSPQEKQALLEAKSIYERAQTLMALSQMEIAGAGSSSGKVTIQ